jgi:hypothetical protein
MSKPYSSRRALLDSSEGLGRDGTPKLVLRSRLTGSRPSPPGEDADADEGEAGRGSSAEADPPACGTASELAELLGLRRCGLLADEAAADCGE